jgi:hypothetical protein
MIKDFNCLGIPQNSRAQRKFVRSSIFIWDYILNYPSQIKMSEGIFKIQNRHSVGLEQLEGTLPVLMCVG